MNQEFENKYKLSQKKRQGQSKQATSMDAIEYVQKSLFEKMFNKSIFLFALSNSSKIMQLLIEIESDSAPSGDQPPKQSQGGAARRTTKSDQEKLWQTLNAIIY